MISPKPSLSTSISSSSSSDGEEVGRPASSRALPPQTTVNVRSVVVEPGATVPGVLEGNINQVHLTVLVNASDINPEKVDELVSNATKIKSETCRSFFSSDNNNSFKNLIGTKEDVEGLRRRWCYLITALVVLSLITLLGTAVLSVTSLKSSQVAELNPAIQATLDGLSDEERQFAAIPAGPRIITRSMWEAALPRKPFDTNTVPVTKVIICHTATKNCSSQLQCMDKMRAMQSYQQETRLFSDLGYNFVIGGDGSVYWSRGFAFVGEHTRAYNRASIAVAFIGNYITVLPNESQIEAFNKLMEVGLKEGRIATDYTLVAQCQLQVTAAPGLTLVHNMATWPHYNSSLPIDMCTSS